MRSIRRILVLLAAVALSAGCGRWFFDLAGTRCSQEEPDCGPELVCDFQQQLCVDPSSVASDGGSDPADGGSDPTDGGSDPTDGGSDPTDGGSDAGDAGTDPDCSIPGFIRCDSGRSCCRTYQLALSDSHTCAAVMRPLSGIREVYCWGSNAQGQLGDTTDLSTKPSPTEVTALRGLDIGALAADSDHTCAIVSITGELWCWGDNYWGQVYPTLDSETPQAPQSITSISQSLNQRVGSVAVGSHHTCVIEIPDNVLRCWGENHEGQLGLNDVSLLQDKQEGVVFLNETNTATAVSVAAGISHTCAVVDDLAQRNAVSCWGDAEESGTNSVGGVLNAYGRLADSNGTPLSASAVMARNLWTCALPVGSSQIHGGLTCWGSSDALDPSPSRIPRNVAVGRFLRLAMGNSFACLLREDGHVDCFGNNAFGQLGRGDSAPSVDTIPAPIRLSDSESLSFSSVAAGGSHACAVTDDGRLFCWGANNDGQLGRGTTEGSGLPAPVAYDP